MKISQIIINILNDELIQGMACGFIFLMLLFYVSEKLGENEKVVNFILGENKDE